VVLPFLAVAAQPPERIIRSRDIIAEVEAYMDYIENFVVPYASIPQEVVDQMDLPEPPPVPSCLEELERSEKWGFPNEGSWMDQPCEWMADIEAAQRGRWKSQQKHRTEDASDPRNIFRNAPTGDTL
jgi:hypothetical protein